MKSYAFTDHQLSELLHGTIGMFLEYRDQHGKDDESEAAQCAVRDMIEGLDAEMEMFDNGDLTSLKLQSLL